MNEEPRLFVAVPLSESARAAVAEVVERIRADEPEGRGVRWVRLDGLHITLRFLGPTPESRVADVAAAVATTAAGVAPFAIRVAGADAFPPVGRPRTLWLDLDRGVDDLAGLAARLDDALADLGWERERRPFRAHLTLARADGVRAGPATVAALRAAAAELAIESPIERVVLFESITGSGRARYIDRADVALG
ncbi:MAG TPA: RNA 2',3'-cyclic phosphodiesterase [Candidatus Limnocylindrales bacterium]|nr:RNA 2',3'-cyclic phosphodiesterase [Candidatus Limnocylindrales bacterium]